MFFVVINLHLFKHFVIFKFFFFKFKNLFFLEKKLFYFGDNKYGQSGIGNSTKLESIVRVDFFEENKLKLKKICCGDDCFNVFLTSLIIFNSFLFFLIFFFFFCFFFKNENYVVVKYTLLEIMIKVIQVIIQKIII
jgi:hypothetical protein